MTITLHEADSRKILREMAERGEFVDSVVCDPPYGLVSVTKRFGKGDAKPAKHGRDGAFARQSKGFMGKVWDGTAIERDPEFWRLVFDVMKPGAYILAFSSSRTYHHMAVAMEMAGFITHPMIGWTFASGFPKAHNAARAVDAVGGNGETWNGWHYGGQARKPALEPIYVGQKPFSEKNGALNILKHGVGAVNIDGCRVAGEPWKAHSATGLASVKFFTEGDAPVIDKVPNDLGRWPANLIHDGSDEVLALFPESKGAVAPVRGTEASSKTENVYGEFAGRAPSDRRDEGGSAARFFESYAYATCPVCEGSEAVLATAGCDVCGSSGILDLPPIFHCPKASKRDRAGSKHPTVKPIALMRALIRHVTPPGGTVLDPFAGSGTTGQAARDEGMRALLIEMEAEYARDIRRRLGLPAPTAFDFDDLLGEAVPTHSTECGAFEDLLG